MSDPRIEQYREWLEGWNEDTSGLSHTPRAARSKFNELFPPDPPVESIKCLTCGTSRTEAGWMELFHCDECTQGHLYNRGME